MSTTSATIEGGWRYRGREGQWSYLLNRVAGLAVLLFLAIHILDTSTVYFFPDLYSHAIDLYRTTPVMLGEIALVAAVLYHGLNGYKIIYFDQRPDRWNERNSRRFFWGVIAASVLLWLPAAYLMGRALYLNNICRCAPESGPPMGLPLWADVGIALALLAALIVISRMVSFRTPEGGLSRNFETWMWLFMRWSGVLLVPLVWIHVLLNDVIVGVHGISLDYVALRWATIGWRIYDAALLAFTFAHGMNGLRNVLSDYVRNPAWRAFLPRLLLVGWVTITAVGAAALIGGVR